MNWPTANTTANSVVFLDANVLVYALDKTSEHYADTVAMVQRLLREETTLCSSHHVIEEVLHVARKIQTEFSASRIVNEISKIPALVLVEPAAELDFAKRYAALSERLRLGVNDALILQLMLDAGITHLYSFDKKLLAAAKKLKIVSVA